MERGVIVWVGVCHGLCLSARYRAVGNAPSGLRLALDELTLRACSNASSAAEGGLLRARANRVMAPLDFGLWSFRFPLVLVRTGRRLPVQALCERTQRRVLVALTGYPRGLCFE